MNWQNIWRFEHPHNRIIFNQRFSDPFRAGAFMWMRSYAGNPGFDAFREKYHTAQIDWTDSRRDRPSRLIPVVRSDFRPGVYEDPWFERIFEKRLRNSRKSILPLRFSPSI